jgi:hypothetical protein
MEGDPRPWLERANSGYKISNVIGLCCNGRRFAVTHQGYMAIVPPGTREGDIVCPVLGADLPFIMRPRAAGSPGNNEGYLIVGNAMFMA